MLIFYIQGSGVSWQSLLCECKFGVCVLIGVSEVYCEKMQLSVTTVFQCTVIKFFVKEKQLKCSDCYAYALVLPVSEDGYLFFILYFCSFNPATWGHSPLDIEHIKNLCNINKPKYVQEKHGKRQSKYLHIKYNTCHILEIKNINASIKY